MKHVLLSYDGPIFVYSVPDVVADNLSKYCCEFANKWLWTSPHAKEYRISGGVCYGAKDFIAYLNKWKFRKTPSVLLETLDNVWDGVEIPEKYQDCERFNF